MAAATQFRQSSIDNLENKVQCTFRFVASSRWLTDFLKSYRISNRRVIRYVSKKEMKLSEEVIESATQFQTLIQSISSDYSNNLIINTDQTGCEYQVNVSRTYTHKREKTALY